MEGGNRLVKRIDGIIGQHSLEGAEGTAGFAENIFVFRKIVTVRILNAKEHAPGAALVIHEAGLAVGCRDDGKRLTAGITAALRNTLAKELRHAFNVGHDLIGVTERNRADALENVFFHAGGFDKIGCIDMAAAVGPDADRLAVKYIMAQQFKSFVRILSLHRCASSY